MPGTSRSGPGEGAVRVKLCGTARLDDLRLACQLEADYVGFIFAESPRRVRPEDVAAWRRGISGPVPSAVGVFVNPTLAEIESAVRVAALDYIQLHGDESPEFCARASAIAPVIKAVPLDGPRALAALDACGACFAVLVEPRHPTKRGGTGIALDLDLARRAAGAARIFLAGGLRPDTVAEAVRAVRPYAVDVVSGVEAEPGRKDPALARRFVTAAREAVAR